MALSQEEIEKRVNDSYELPNNVLKAVPEPMVTVRTSTYQHGPYIEECIEGVLMQETDFPIEFIIGEDFSTDGTRKMVFEYAEKYPDIIRVITADYNVGSKANGRRCINAARGKYMALCEGDDYWTDPLKLQKQVDILEKGGFAGIAHNSKMKYEYETQNQRSTFLNENIGDQIFSTNDLIESRKFHTASFLFKKNCIDDLDYPNILSGDRFLFSVVALHGEIYYIDEIMCIYRRNSGGISRNVTVEMMKRDLKMPHSLSELNADYPVYKSLSFIHYTIVMYSFDASIYDIIKHSFLFLFYSFAEFPNNLRSILVFLIKGLPKKIIKSK